MSDDAYPKPPDLQEWVARYGGYHKIPWPEWNAAMAAWHVARRIHTAGYVNDTPEVKPKRAGASRPRR
jgi:hypothetical protein